MGQNDDGANSEPSRRSAPSRGRFRLDANHRAGRVTIADGRCVALRKQSRRELGEIVRSVPLQEEKRPVAAHGPLTTLAA
jgi:hypothetical protein